MVLAVDDSTHATCASSSRQSSPQHYVAQKPKWWAALSVSVKCV